jgi:UDP-N-acetylmuramoyl-tripeptide--D-alanyl-D-alanine ligase
MPVATDAIVLTIRDAAEIVGGRTAGTADVDIEGFTIDSRTVRPGDLFIALKGEHVDGAAFAQAAIDRGAGGVLVPPGTTVSGGAAIVVTDPLLALQRLGAHVRQAAGTKLVAITGSAGKTSTKEAAAAFLGLRYRVYRNPGNLNNHIGLPLSLLELRTRPDVAVVELGMNHAGEIRRLVELARPDVRVWTNVGDAHLGHFSSVEAIAAAKAELLDGAESRTCFIANADDPRVMARVPGFPGRVRTFGVSSGASVRATAIEDRGVRGATVRIDAPGASADFDIPLPGHGQLMNVLAATAVALEFEVPLAAIATRAATLQPAPRRGQVVRLGRGVVLVDDSYNSSPSALAMTLATLGSESTAPRRVAALGEMLELGPFAEELHREAGRQVVEAGVDLLFAVGGAPARALAASAVAAGLPADRAAVFETSAAASAAVADALRPGDVVLVKGSRGIRMDIVADRVKAEWS